MRSLMTVASISAAAMIAAAAPSRAQHYHAHPAASAPPQPAADAREFVPFPPALAEHTLANMRDHLLALQEMQARLGAGDVKGAAGIAEARLGMSSLGLHGAHEAARYMPQGMQEAGTAMHRAASRFAIVATDAAVTGDMKPVFAGLAGITAACVACHAGYRIK